MILNKRLYLYVPKKQVGVNMSSMTVWEIADKNNLTSSKLDYKLAEIEYLKSQGYIFKNFYELFTEAL